MRESKCSHTNTTVTDITDLINAHALRIEYTGMIGNRGTAIISDRTGTIHAVTLRIERTHIRTVAYSCIALTGIAGITVITKWLAHRFSTSTMRRIIALNGDATRAGSIAFLTLS